jgi:hypothetical protein
VTTFGKETEKGGGVRCYISWEYGWQVTRIGVQNITDEWVKVCVSKDYSKKLAKKLDAHLNQDMKLCVGMVELAAVTDGGLPFCNNCYILEGDAPLVFTTNPCLKKLDSLVRDPYKFGFK